MTLLKRLRLDRGLRQIDLARMLYVDKSEISKWERGVRSISSDMLKPAADALGWQGDPYALMGQVGADE